MAFAKITWQDSAGVSGEVDVASPVQVVQLGRVDDNYEVVEEFVLDGKRYVTSKGCVPEAPFYIRWINNLGGYDYKMFSRKKIVGEEVTGISNVQTTPLSPYDTQATIDAEGIQLVTTGEEGLPRAEYDILVRLARSPRIQWWNEGQQQWHVVVLQKESKQQWDTANGLGSVEFTFQMPRIKMQF